MRFEKTSSIPRYLVAIPAALVLLGGCALNGAGSHAYTAVTSAPATPFAATAAGDVVNGRFCGDATGSTSDKIPRFGSMMRSDIADAVETWAHPAPADPTGTDPVNPAGAASQPGLSLQMRWVNTDSLSDMNALTVSIPGVESIVPEPRPSASATFVADDSTWHASATDVAKAARTAVAASSSAAKQIRAFRWPNGNSGISSCISALIQDLPAGHDVLIVASDGEQNEPPQVAGNLHGAAVLWVMPNPSGSAKTEAALQASWKKVLLGLGARSVTFIRPESASAAMFANVLKGA